MDITYFFYLSSGLFLGWSLGVNDSSNIFGTAVGTKMVRFSTIATISAIFVILGAVYGGSGASETLGTLGNVNALAGAFMVALSAGLAVYWMARTGLTVSTSQTVVGAIVGWNIYAEKETDVDTLAEIFATWTACPLLSGTIAIGLYFIFKKAMRDSSMHLLMQDQITRIGLIVTAALCAYALGANNIANVVGVFANSSPFKPLDMGIIKLSSQQILFLLGSIAISVGMLTYSKKVIMTVGNNLMKMTPTVAWIVVLSQALVLLLFSSTTLHDMLEKASLPTIPLVPVSCTQAVIGAIIGIGLVKGGRGINWNIVGKIIAGWVVAPVMAMIICFISLFFLENVFNQVVVNG